MDWDEVAPTLSRQERVVWAREGCDALNVASVGADAGRVNEQAGRVGSQAGHVDARADRVE